MTEAETLEYAGRLARRIAKMRLKDWDDAKPNLIEELSKRDDMPTLFQQFSTKDVAECRIRVALRRAYRKRHGLKADVAHAEITTHTNFGRF